MHTTAHALPITWFIICAASTVAESSNTTEMQPWNLSNYARNLLIGLTRPNLMVICDYCQNEAELVTGQVIYPHRPELASSLYWKCAPCKARVGCHAGTAKPLGRLADVKLRHWKMAAHDVFDPIWKNGRQSRREAYQYLADKLGIHKNDCHIGMFDVATCKRVVEILTGGKG